MKKEVDTLDAKPSKRLYQSIIADYDLNRGICELVDNGLDVWSRGGRKAKIVIDVELNKDQQLIRVSDNAGGLPRSDLNFIVAPGHSGNAPGDETIGFFGVGTKRAVVALAQDIRIITRHKKDQTYQIDLDDKWLEDDEWDLPLYEVDDIKEGTTIVELHRLRLILKGEAIDQLRDHLSAVYAKFLSNNNVTIRLNGKPLEPRLFDGWSYPPKYPPSRYTGTLQTEDGHEVQVEVIAGLADESSPTGGEYGVYFYCNDRLVARGMKTFEVGFARGLAGPPHPKISLTKVLVSLKGEAQSMPWNSSKSDVSTKHEVFVALHDWLVEVVKDYASLSRIWMGEWPEKVFKYETGAIKEVEIDDFPTARKSMLPPMPKSRPRFGDVVAAKNQAAVAKKPWVKGLYEGVIAADLIFKQKLDQKNRIALIVLDSTLEIAFKEFLVNDSGHHYNDAALQKIFAARHLVHAEIKKYSSISTTLWKKIEYYYKMRCNLVHQRASAGVSDNEIKDFRAVTEKVLSELYKLKFNA